MTALIRQAIFHTGFPALLLMLAVVGCSEQKEAPISEKTIGSSRQPGSPNKNLPSGLIPHHAVGEKIIVVGKLGVPVGDLITISGTKGADFPTRFLADTVNGKKLPTPIPLLIPFVAAWPSGTSGTLQGREEGFISHAATAPKSENGGELNQDTTHSQQVTLKFKVTKVIDQNGTPPTSPLPEPVPGPIPLPASEPAPLQPATP